MNNFVGNNLQNKSYAYCYILLSGTHQYTPICGAAMLPGWNHFAFMWIVFTF